MSKDQIIEKPHFSKSPTQFKTIPPLNSTNKVTYMHNHNPNLYFANLPNWNGNIKKKKSFHFISMV